MTRRSGRVLLGIVAASALISLLSFLLVAIDVAVEGGWTMQITGTDLQGGPGTDLVDSHTSAVDQVWLAVSGTTGPGDSWQITVSRTEALWHAELTVQIRRTGDGIGGSLSGGTDFQVVGAAGALLFSGEDDIADIPLQLRVSGLSVQIPPAAYATTITLTVVDL